jgi:UDP-glucose:glycoprotein glucosyltransferase
VAPNLLIPRLTLKRETAAEENSALYFPLLDRVAEGHFKQATTDQELYTTFLDLLRKDGHLDDTEALSSFQLALSLHSAAPRIAAHYQYYNTTVQPPVGLGGEDCSVWVDFQGKQYCDSVLDLEEVGPPTV